MDQNKRSWFFLVGLVIFLIGAYGSLRVVVNFLAFDKYPFGGVIPSIPVSFGTNSSNYQETYQTPKEQDCVITSVYYETDNVTIRKPSPEEITRDEEWKSSCLENIKELRNNQKITDSSQSLLWLLMGAGLLIYQKNRNKSQA